MPTSLQKLLGIALVPWSLALLVSRPTLAHEGMTHAGKAIHGVISTFANDRLTLETEHGSMLVTLTAETSIEQGGKTVGRETLRVGALVTVSGTTLPGGEVVAREIQIEPPGAAAPPGAQP